MFRTIIFTTLWMLATGCGGGAGFEGGSSTTKPEPKAKPKTEKPAVEKKSEPEVVLETDETAKPADSTDESASTEIETEATDDPTVAQGAMADRPEPASGEQVAEAPAPAPAPAPEPEQKKAFGVVCYPPGQPQLCQSLPPLAIPELTCGRYGLSEKSRQVIAVGGHTGACGGNDGCAVEMQCG